MFDSDVFSNPPGKYKVKDFWMHIGSLHGNEIDFQLSEIKHGCIDNRMKPYSPCSLRFPISLPCDP